jgi:lactoylglutathione lyase
MVTAWLLALAAIGPRAPALANPFAAMQPYLVGLSVADAERSAKWYVEMLGFREIRRMDLSDHGLKIVFLRTGSFRLELVEKKGSAPLRSYAPAVKDDMLVQGVKKFAFLVSDVDAAASALRTRGVPFEVEPFVDKEMKLRSFLVGDPDGNVVQFMQEMP